MHSPISYNLVLCFIWKIITPETQIQNFGQLFGCEEQFCLLQLPISYCVSLIMVTITKYVFKINIFRMTQFSAMKLAWIMWKTWAFLWFQNLQKFEKKKV